jgi:hypothetical protein
MTSGWRPPTTTASNPGRAKGLRTLHPRSVRRTPGRHRLRRHVGFEGGRKASGLEGPSDLLWELPLLTCGTSFGSSRKPSGQGVLRTPRTGTNGADTKTGGGASNYLGRQRWG